MDGDLSASTAVARTTTELHVFNIKGYPWMIESFLPGEFIASKSFVARERSMWHVWLYPDGDEDSNAGFIGLFAALAFATSAMNAKVGFDVLDLSGEPVPRYSRTCAMRRFDRAPDTWGFPRFVSREELERSANILKDGCFSVRCSVTVVEFAAEAADIHPPLAVAVPPPDPSLGLFRHLLGNERGADVRFLVGGQAFFAHRSVLAARSPVFRAELCGAMREGGAAERCIRIDGMRPEAFGNLLYFVYADALSPEVEAEEDAAMDQHLMEAADRYGVERLKLICEDRLCRHLDAGTAATTLVLAEQHGCRGLKEVCLRFLMSKPTLEAVMATDGYHHLVNN